MGLGLPEVEGAHSVGATTFVLPLSPLVIGDSQLEVKHTDRKHLHDPATSTGSEKKLEPSLVLEEVAFTLFYPTNVDKHHGGSWFGRGKYKKGLDWLIRPVHETLQGYEHFGDTPYPSWLGPVIRPLLGTAGSLIKIPVWINAPLAPPSAPNTPWPLVVFSHGLAGSRTTYSHICQRIASTGRVVIAMEHRDGSGPTVFPRSAEHEGEVRVKYYIKPEDVIWPPPQTKRDPIIFRHDQLEFRRHEVFAAYAALTALASSNITPSAEPSSSSSSPPVEAGGLATIDGAPIDWPSFANKRIATESVLLAGHSFGGATVFSLLSNPPPPNRVPASLQQLETYKALPVTDALILDPWMDPLPEPGPTPCPDPDGGETRAPKMLVLQSEAFTLWEGHFDRVLKASKIWPGGRVLTLVRAQHVSFSDFPLLVPDRFQSAPALPLATLIDRLSLVFFDRRMDMRDDEVDWENLTLGEDLADVPLRPMEVARDPAKGKRRLVGSAGDVVVH